MQNTSGIINKGLNLSVSTLFVFFTIFLVFMVSCKRPIRKDKNTFKTVEDIGFIVSTEQMSNRFIDNGLYYFVPAKTIDSVKPGLSFREKNFKPGYGIVLYSSYYIRLINVMSWDLIYYELNLKKNDPFRLKLEYRRILPVKFKFTFDSTYLKNSPEKDSVLVNDSMKFFFKYKMVGKIKIEKLEILIPKHDDMNRNAKDNVINHFGKFGKIVRN